MGTANQGSFVSGSYRTLSSDGHTRQFLTLRECNEWAEKEMHRTGTWVGIEERENDEWLLIGTVETPEMRREAARRATETPTPELIETVESILQGIREKFGSVACVGFGAIVELADAHGNGDLIRKSLILLVDRDRAEFITGRGYRLKEA